MSEMSACGGSLWYMDEYKPLADTWSSDFHTACMMPDHESQWAYRLDVDAAGSRAMGREGTESALASLATNSSDSLMPGYPYGLLGANRRVRLGTASATEPRFTIWGYPTGWSGTAPEACCLRQA